MASDWYNGAIDLHKLGKKTLASIADRGATRAGNLVAEIKDNISRLNQAGKDNEYLKHHLDALFTEFITGEDYDLLYYDKPKRSELSMDPSSSNQIEITDENVSDIEDTILYEIALQHLDKGEINWLDKRHMSKEWHAENSDSSCIFDDCKGCPACWDKAYKDLLDVPIKKKWYQEDIELPEREWIMFVAPMLASIGIFCLIGIVWAVASYMGLS